MAKKKSSKVRKPRPVTRKTPGTSQQQSETASLPEGDIDNVSVPVTTADSLPVAVTNSSAPSVMDADSSTDALDYIKVGASDKSGRKITIVFYKQPDEYAIYGTVGGYVRYAGKSAKLSDSGEVQEELANTIHLVMGFPWLTKLYASVRANALKAAFDGNPDVAIKLLRKTQREIKAMLTRYARFAYLSGALMLTMLIAVVRLTAYIFDWPSGTAETILNIALFASMGGFLSVSLGSKKLSFDLRSGFRSNMLYGTMRVVIAVICGVIAHYLVESNIALGFLNTKNSDTVHGLYIAYFVAGFSETLIPHLLSKIEDRQSAEE